MITLSYIKSKQDELKSIIKQYKIDNIALFNHLIGKYYQLEEYHIVRIDSINGVEDDMCYANCYSVYLNVDMKNIELCIRKDVTEGMFPHNSSKEITKEQFIDKMNEFIGRFNEMTSYHLKNI